MMSLTILEGNEYGTEFKLELEQAQNTVHEEIPTQRKSLDTKRKN